jgi:hypothetical protein
MLPILRAKYGSRFEYDYTILKTDLLKVGTYCGFRQMPIWIQAMMSCIPKVDEVALGYVMNDDAISYLKELQGLFKAFQHLCVEKYPKIVFPLSKIKKNDFYLNLYSDLLDKVVWCENPNQKSNGEFQHCGRCIPCEHSPIARNIKSNENSSKAYVETFNKTDDAQLQLPFPYYGPEPVKNSEDLAQVLVSSIDDINSVVTKDPDEELLGALDNLKNIL